MRSGVRRALGAARGRLSRRVARSRRVAVHPRLAASALATCMLAIGCQSPKANVVVDDTPARPPLLAAAPERRAPSGEAYRAVLEAEMRVERGELVRAVELLREAVVHDPRSARLRVRLGELLLAVGDLEEAREEARTALDLEPAHLEAARLYALTHVQLGEKGKARAFLERALERHPGDRPLSSMLAELYLERGDVRAAEGVIEKLMRTEPGAIDGYVTLARLFADRGEVGPALANVDRALARDERAIEALELKRTLLFAQGRFQDAHPLVERLVAERGDSAETRQELLVATLLAGEHETGRELMRAWLDEDRGEQTLLVITSALESAGRRAQALDLVLEETKGAPAGRLAIEAGRLAYDARRFDVASRLLCRVKPDEGNLAWFEYARALCVRALERGGQPKEAARAVEEGLSAAPTSWRLLSAMITLSRREGTGLGKEEVWRAVDTAREEAPDDLDLLEVAVRAREEHGEVAAGRALLDAALEARPEAPELLMMLARFLERTGDAHGAIGITERLMVREAPGIELLNFTAFTLADHGLRAEKAVRYAWRAVLKGPLNGYVIDTLGWAQLRAGHVERAVEVLSRADRLSPDEPEILYHLAEALRRSGKLAPALAHARRALALAEPDDPARADLEVLVRDLERLEGTPN